MFRNNRKRLWIVTVLSVLICCSGCEKRETVSLETIKEDQMDEITNDAAGTDHAASEDVICVYVCGAVMNAGVYELPSGSRLYEAVQAAGGMNEQAADTYLNQAEALSDGQRIYVPTHEEADTQMTGMNGSGGLDGAGAESGKVNLNTADKEELMGLSGIGEAKADAIIRYREANGPFQRIEDVMIIEGIKEGVFNKMKEDITVG